MIDQEVLTAIQFTVVEPPNGGASWPSGLWTRDEVVGSLTQRQSLFLKNSLVVVNSVTNVTSQQDVPPSPNPPSLQAVIGQTVITLPQDCLRIVSLVWVGANGTVRELERTDWFEADHLLPTWETTPVAAPLVYMEDAPTRSVRIAPASTMFGVFNLLYVPSGTPLTGNGMTFTVPEECVHGIKYGTLADLFGKDGQGQDPARAAYCEQRFNLAIELARLVIRGWA